MKAKSIIPFTLGILVAVSIPVSYSLKTKHFEVNFKKVACLTQNCIKKIRQIVFKKNSISKF